MKKKILILFTLFSLLSCKQDKIVDKISSIKELTSKSENFIAYSNNINQLLRLTLSGEITFKNAKMELLKQGPPKTSSLADLKQYYKDADVIGYNEYATLIYNRQESLKKLIAEIPELKNLTKAEFKQIMKVKSNITKNEVEKAAKINHDIY